MVATKSSSIGSETVVRFDSNGAATESPWAGTNVNYLGWGLWAAASGVDFSVRADAPIELSSVWFSPDQTATNQAVQKYTIAVKCRPVDQSTAGAFGALHCYIVTKRRDHTIWTIQGGEADGQPVGRLSIFVDPGDRVGPNRPTDPVYYSSDESGDFDGVDCLTATGGQIDEMRLPYHFLGPNSNSAVVEMMRVCGRAVALPPKAVGFNVRLGPWR